MTTRMKFLLILMILVFINFFSIRARKSVACPERFNGDILTGDEVHPDNPFLG